MTQLDCSHSLKKLNSFKRSHLNLMATRLGVPNVLIFKNKMELSLHISKINKAPSERCYNKEDPFTLEKIDLIDQHHFVEWNQYERHFGANICTLKYMFDNSLYILPWSIDFASGLDKSSNIVEYNLNFDMRKVEDLNESILNYENYETPNIKEKNFSFLFAVDDLLKFENYSYAFIVNNIMNNDVDNIYRIMTEGMYTMHIYLHNQNHINKDIFYQYVYLNYSLNACHVRVHSHHLRFMVNVFQNLYEIIGENASIILNIMFMDMEKSTVRSDT